jgi:hypothetical protein
MGAHRCVFYFELSNPLPKVNDIRFFDESVSTLTPGLYEIDTLLCVLL